MGLSNFQSSINYMYLLNLLSSNWDWDLGLGTWDLGPGTWDLGPGTWDLGNWKWEMGIESITRR